MHEEEEEEVYIPNFHIYNNGLVVFKLSHKYFNLPKLQ